MNLLRDKFGSREEKRAASLFNSFRDIVARQVVRFCCSYYRALKSTVEEKWLGMVNKAKTKPDYGMRDLDPIMEERMLNKLELAGPMVDSYLKHIGLSMQSKLGRSKNTGLLPPTTVFIPWSIFRHICMVVVGYGGDMKTTQRTIELTIYTTKTAKKVLSPKNKTTEVFLEEVGLRTAKAVGKYLLQENVYDSNLLSDISAVDYADQHLGRTDLQPLEGLEPFVDDLYIFGFCGRELLHLGFVEPPLGTAVRTKIYNNIVCNFEAGEVLAAVGGRLADYVSCPNKRLQKTFEHPDVEKRGCTRIEISVYNPSTSKEQATEAIDRTRELVSGKLFVVQSPAQQWKLLAEKVDRNLVVSNRELGDIFVAWYGHSETGRICGVHLRPKNVCSDAKWKKSVEYAISAFGFRSCPLYYIEILATEPHILLAPLRCYTKEADAKTILARAKYPMQTHLSARDPTSVLPTGKHIEWVWRTKKTKAIGIEKIPFPILEIETE
ncbi:hypothetical protein QZH41_003615, partial [Actinostola sp. cb2023]